MRGLCPSLGGLRGVRTQGCTRRGFPRHTACDGSLGRVPGAGRGVSARASRAHGRPAAPAGRGAREWSALSGREPCPGQGSSLHRYPETSTSANVHACKWGASCGPRGDGHPGTRRGVSTRAGGTKVQASRPRVARAGPGEHWRTERRRRLVRRAPLRARGAGGGPRPRRAGTARGRPLSSASGGNRPSGPRRVRSRALGEGRGGRGDLSAGRRGGTGPSGLWAGPGEGRARPGWGLQARLLGTKGLVAAG